MGVSRSLRTIALVCALLFAWSPVRAQTDEGPTLEEAILEFADALEEARNTVLPDVVAFTESQLTRTLQATRDLRQVELDQAPTVGMEAPGFTGIADALAGNAQARAVLRAQKLTPQKYVAVLYSIGIALQAMQNDMEDMRAELAAFQEMPEADRAVLEQLMGPILKVMEQVVSQPPGNIALVRKYAEQIEATGAE